MKSKIKKATTKKISLGLSIFCIGIFALICLFAVNYIFNSRQANEDNWLSNLNIHRQKNSPTVKLIAKNSTDSAKPKNIVAYHPLSSGFQLRVPILYYHYVGNNPNPADLQRNALSISPDKFDEQMSYLKSNGYTSISLDTLYAALKKQVTIPNKSVVLTFDDGYIDFYYNAYPILKKYGLSATEFIPTGLMGQGAYLMWSQIKEMHASGLILFGAHSVHHYALNSLSKDIMVNEIVESKRVLQEKLGVPINFMAYPYGSVNGQVISEVIRAGFIGAVGTWPGKDQSEGAIYDMPRMRVSGSINLTTFAGLL